MSAYRYKIQFQIVISLMALHNYIIRKTQKDHVFIEFDRHLNFIPDDI
jgi:hypothetical protein